MEIPFTGGCACGAVRYECTAEPFLSGNCHCRDCQRFSGTAYAAGLFVPAGGFRFTKGEPKYYGSIADSGQRVGRGFCADCGSPVAATQGDLPLVVIYAASLDDPGAFRAMMDIFTLSAQPWDHMDPALPKYARRPGLAFNAPSGTPLPSTTSQRPSS